MLLIALLMTLAGVAFLLAGWNARRAGFPARRRVFTVTGWLLLAGALLPWGMALGPDKGATFALITFMLAGCVLVARAGFVHAGNGRREKLERDARKTERGSGTLLFLRRAYVFLLAGPVAAAAALASGAVMFAGWNVETGSAANRLAAALLFVPIAWALLATFATYDVRLRYRSFGVFAVLLAAALGITMISQVS